MWLTYLFVEDGVDTGVGFAEGPVDRVSPDGEFGGETALVGEILAEARSLQLQAESPCRRRWWGLGRDRLTKSREGTEDHASREQRGERRGGAVPRRGYGEAC
jgi:hypothetical protein